MYIKYLTPKHYGAVMVVYNHQITEILLKVALNTITLTPKYKNSFSVNILDVCR